MFADKTSPLVREPPIGYRDTASPNWAAAKRKKDEWNPHESGSLRWIVGLVSRARGLPPDRK